MFLIIFLNIVAIFSQYLLGAPELVQGSRFEQLWINIIRGRMRSNLTNCSLQFLRRFLNMFPMYFSDKIWTLLCDQRESGGHYSNNLEYTLHWDAFIVISQIEALQFLRRCLKFFTIYFNVKIWTPLGAQVLIRRSRF